MTRPTCARLSPRDPTHAGSEYATRTVDTWAERSRRLALRAGFCRAFEVLRVRVLWTRRAQSRGLWNRLTADRVLTVVRSAGRRSWAIEDCRGESGRPALRVRTELVAPLAFGAPCGRGVVGAGLLIPRLQRARPQIIGVASRPEPATRATQHPRLRRRLRSPGNESVVDFWRAFREPTSAIEARDSRIRPGLGRVHALGRAAPGPGERSLEGPVEPGVQRPLQLG